MCDALELPDIMYAVPGNRDVLFNSENKKGFPVPDFMFIANVL